jgi:hypothetical protein
VVAVLSWVRSRPIRRPDREGAMRAHEEYLDALGQTARSKDRGPLAGGPAPVSVAAPAEESPVPVADPGDPPTSAG